MSYKANIASNFFNQGLHLILGLLTSILVARALGSEGQGYIAYIILIFTLISNYGHLGLNNALMYFHKRQGVDSRHLYHVNFSFLLIIFTALCAIVLGGWKAGWFLQDYPLLMIAGGLVFVLAGFIYYNHYAWFISSERIRESNRFNILVFLIKSLFIIVFWFLGVLWTGSYFWITLAAMVLNALLLQIRLKRGFRFVLDARLLKREFAYGSIVYLAAVFDYLHLRVDQLFIKNMMDISELGVYSMAVTLSELMLLIPLSINTALTGRLYNTDEDHVGRKVMAQTMKLSFYICLAVMIVGIPLCFAIPWFYGEDFRGAILPTIILLGGVVFASLARIASPFFFTSGRPMVIMRIALFCLLLNIVLNWLMIPAWGITGAAISSAISYFLYGLYFFIILIRKEGFRLGDFFQLQIADFKAVWSQL